MAGVLDPRPAYAIHGGMMLGTDLFLIGMLIDGRREEDRLRVGPTALTLGAVGIAAGAWFGATEVDEREDGVFYGVPTGALAIGGVAIGGIAALATSDSDKAMQRFVISAAGGLAIGLAGTAAYVLDRRRGRRASSRRSGAGGLPSPRVSVGPQKVTLSLGGAF